VANAAEEAAVPAPEAEPVTTASARAPKPRTEQPWRAKTTRGFVPVRARRAKSAGADPDHADPDHARSRILEPAVLRYQSRAPFSGDRNDESARPLCTIQPGHPDIKDGDFRPKLLDRRQRTRSATRRPVARRAKVESRAQDSARATDDECWGYTKVSSTPSSNRSRHAHLV
jgi:hypothetical protein